MRVVVPHAGGYPEIVARVLKHDGLEPVVADVSGAMDAYARLFCEEWERCAAAGDDLVIVEHDIVPWPGAVGYLARCPEPWCAYPYFTRGGDYNLTGLGCAYFSARLLREHAGAGRAVLEHLDNWPSGDWRVLDSRLDVVLRARGVTCHQHGPGVAHLNPLIRRSS